MTQAQPLRGVAKRRGRRELTELIAASLDLAPPDVPDGSTVGTEFLDPVVRALGGVPVDLANTYRKLEWALEAVGEVYDPNRDSSEHRRRRGGGTITNSGYRKLLRGLANEPSCFLLSVTDHAAGAEYEDVPGHSVGFNAQVSGHSALLEAGEGSRVIFYRTGKSSAPPRKAFVGHAVVSTIEDSGAGHYRAFFAEYQEFTNPVSADDILIANWNRRHAMTEIDYKTFSLLVEAGTGGPVGTPLSRVISDWSEPPAVPAPISDTVASENNAQNQFKHLVPVDSPLDFADRADSIPDLLPELTIQPSAEAPPALDDDSDDRDAPTGASRPHGAARRELDRYAEQRAVYLVRRHFASAGWRLYRDCQRLGTGYDFEYRKGARRLNVEVKGIQGVELLFNVTAKEWIRVLEDPNFVVVAVTSVLDPRRTRLRILTRPQLAAARRRPVQYRIAVGAPFS